MIKRKSKLIGMFSSLVGIVLPGIFIILLLLDDSDNTGCGGGDGIFYILVWFCSFVAICSVAGLVSSLFAEKKSKLPGIFMLISSLLGIIPITSFLISEGFYFSSVLYNITQLTVLTFLIVPFLGILYAAVLNLFVSSLENTPSVVIRRKATTFTTSVFYTFISLQIFLDTNFYIVEYDLLNKLHYPYVKALYIVLAVTGTACIVGSTFLLKNWHKAAFYTLLPASILGLASISAILCLFANTPYIYIIILVVISITLVETIFLIKDRNR